MLVSCVEKLLGLYEPMLMHDVLECHVNEVSRATVAIEVGDEFLGQHSHELGVEARLEGEVGIVCQRSSSEGPTIALRAGYVNMGSSAEGRCWYI